MGGRDRSPPPLEYSVDLAPSGRASCKKCGRLINQNEPRFCRKVRSPWHDGYDIQYSHMSCGIKWAKSLTDIHMLGILEFRELQRAAAIWDYDLKPVQNQDGFSKYKTMVTIIKKIRDIIFDVNMPAATLITILCHNGYDESTLNHKSFTITRLTHMVADGLLRGIPPRCPICMQMALLSCAYSYYCFGWLAPTTRCDYWSSHNPFGNPSHSGRELDESSRDSYMYIPAQLASLPVWKRIGQILRQLQTQDGISLETTWKFKILSGTNKKARKEQVDMLKEIPRSQLMSGLYISTWGPLEYLDREKFIAAVLRYGGRFCDNPSQLGHPPKNHHSVLIINADKWHDLKSGKSASLLQTGATVLREEYMIALTAKENEKENKEKKNKEKENKEKENKEKENKEKENLLEGKWPTGPILRSASEMKKFRLGGGRSFDVSLASECNDNTISTPQPKIQRHSPLMEVDPDFPQSLKDDSEYQTIIYVDKNNHAFNAKASFVDLKDDKNSFYWLHANAGLKHALYTKVNGAVVTSFLYPSFFRIVEVSRIRHDLSRKRIKPRHVNKRPKRAEKSTAGTDEDLSASESDSASQPPQTPEEWHQLFYESEFIDHAQWSDEQWETAQQVKTAKYFLYRRWGRLGEDDRTTNGSMAEDFGSLQDCILAFVAKFRDITGLDFFKRYTQKSVFGRYQFVDIRGYVWDKNLEPHRTTNHDSTNERRDRTSTFSQGIQRLLADIFSQSTVTATLKEFQVDTGKFQELGDKQLSQAYQVLSDIEQALLRTDGRMDNDKDRQLAKLRGLSSMLYNVIPRAAKKLEPVTTLALLKKECSLLDSLVGAVDTWKLGGWEEAVPHMQIWVTRELDGSEALAKTIKKYVKNGHGVTHGSRRLRVATIYGLASVTGTWNRVPDEGGSRGGCSGHGVGCGRLSKVSPGCELYRDPSAAMVRGGRGSGERVTDGFDDGDFLLWHGTRTSNIASIICSGGLLIAPPEAPKSGYMFDKGLYFTDVASKAVQYCGPCSNGQKAYLFLFEVRLGKCLKLCTANTSIRSDPTFIQGGYNSVHGVGRIQPEDFGTLTSAEILSTIKLDQVKDGSHALGSSCEDTDGISEDPRGPMTIKIPFGKLKKSDTEGSALMYNEYVVYDPDRVTPRFLVEVELEYRSFKDF